MSRPWLALIFAHSYSFCRRHIWRGTPAKKRLRMSLKGPRTRQGQEMVVQRIPRCQRGEMDKQCSMGFRIISSCKSHEECKSWGGKDKNSVVGWKIQHHLELVSCGDGQAWDPGGKRGRHSITWKHTCSVHAAKSNYRGHVSPLARSASKKPTSKAVESAGAGDLPIVASRKSPPDPRKPLWVMRSLNMYVIWAESCEIIFN